MVRSNRPGRRTALGRISPGEVRRAIILVVVAGVLAALFFATAGPPPPEEVPPQSFAFGVFGDAPYYWWEALRFRVLLRAIDLADVASVIHVGDIFWRPCSDEHYLIARARLDRLRHPVVYTPGDNEWSDCWTKQEGRFVPHDRLARLRDVFFRVPSRSLGGRPIALVSQAAEPEYAEFPEHARWRHRGVLFATFHLVGNGNGTKSFPGRRAEDDQEVVHRTRAAEAWLRATFEAARTTDTAAIVLAFHAHPPFEAPVQDPRRTPYEPFLTALEQEAESFARPVLVVHGDDHQYIVDHAVLSHRTRKPLTNVTRVQVPGSPMVGWVRVVFTPGAKQPFRFDPYVVPRWKWW